MNRNKKILRGLDSTSYEHPFDKKALTALQSTPFIRFTDMQTPRIESGTGSL